MACTLLTERRVALRVCALRVCALRVCALRVCALLWHVCIAVACVAQVDGKARFDDERQLREREAARAEATGKAEALRAASVDSAFSGARL
jgi:hypothetical protein